VIYSNTIIREQFVLEFVAHFAIYHNLQAEIVVFFRSLGLFTTV